MNESLWGVSLSRDEDFVLSVGLNKDVTTPLMETPEGQALVLFTSRVSALLYIRAFVQAGYFEPGEYTLYNVLSLPAGSYSQQIAVEFDDVALGSVAVVAVFPAEVPVEYIRYAERRLIEEEHV